MNNRYSAADRLIDAFSVDRMLGSTDIRTWSQRVMCMESDRDAELDAWLKARGKTRDALRQTDQERVDQIGAALLEYPFSEDQKQKLNQEMSVLMAKGLAPYRETRSEKMARLKRMKLRRQSQQELNALCADFAETVAS